MNVTFSRAKWATYNYGDSAQKNPRIADDLNYILEWLETNFSPKQPEAVCEYCVGFVEKDGDDAKENKQIMKRINKEDAVLIALHVGYMHGILDAEKARGAYEDDD